jgi:hypothetical protein
LISTSLYAMTFLIHMILHSQRSGHHERMPGRVYDVHAAKDCRPQAQRDQEPWQGGAGPSSHKTGNCVYKVKFFSQFFFVASIPGILR